jgi:hypothetical protein
MLCAMALAVAWSAPLPARAQDADLTQIRAEIRQLKDAYEKRIQALEKRLQDAEAGALRAQAAAAPTGARSTGESAFNPGISLILQGTAARSSRDPGAYQITGFAPTGGEVSPANRSFNLGESELIVSANVDPYFRGQLVAALTPENALEVEEAFFQTLALGHGLALKGGRYLSAIGYLNEIHRHAWDFQDAPLTYKAFLDGRLNDDGVQLRWVAPTELFLELGAEFGRGRSFPSTEQSRNRTGAWTAFAHLGGDLGASTAWRAGLSYLRASPRERAFEGADSLGNPVHQAYGGTSKLWIADFVLKWAPSGNASLTNLKLQGEYFRRTESGTLAYDDSAQPAPQFGGRLAGDYRSRQSGWYLQGVYQFIPRWRLGYRYDRLHSGRVDVGIVANGLGPVAADLSLLMTAHEPTRHTLMLDWSPTEFSRLRLQFASDKSRQGVTDRQALLQYIFSLGAHGAHRF